MASSSAYPVPKQSNRFRSTIWTAMILLCLIGAAAVLRRVFALVHPAQNAPAQMVALDAAFTQKALLTLVHIVPALVLIGLVPFQFSRSFRNRHLHLHRWMGRTALVL